AQRMVDQVAQLMRRTLEAAEEDLVPLEWELDSARTYLAIEEIRLGSRLEVTYEVDDALAEIAVPPLLLQPVVENAVKHGIAPSTQRGRIEVGARREGEQVILTVRDSGPGLADGSKAGDAAPEDTGRGLEITRNRLRTLYPDQHTLSLRNLQPTGLEVAIHIPGLTLEGASGHVG
ncbi:MAG: ATP-binding protein, partial [Acidobacteriota bacterium]